ncbi:MAG: TIGR00730 family Rossman fold protein [Bacteroidales bacterium]|nr:TIGR00730 family Rossman fold protein [Bacteroidales bacterium]
MEEQGKVKRATIFCASSPKAPQIYFDEAAQLTELLIEQGYGIVYGGGSQGLMGIVADTALQHGAPITGIIPRFMVDVEWQHKGVSDMRLVDTMAERKKTLIDMADAIIILPGSTGTMDELFDAMADKKLGLLHKPIAILNTNKFYSHLAQQLKLMVTEHFMTEKHLKTVFIADTPEELVEYLLQDSDSDNLTLEDGAVK